MYVSHDRLAEGGLYGGQRRKGRSSSPAPSSKAKTDGEGEISSNTSGNREESPPDKRSEIPCRYQNCKKPSCKCWHPPVDQNCKSENRMHLWKKMFFSDMLSRGEDQQKVQESGAKGSFAKLKESTQMGCVSQDSYPRKSIQREQGKLGSKHAVKFSKSTWHHIKFRERKGPSRGVSKSVKLMSATRLLQDLRNEHKTKHCKKDAPAE